MKKNVVLSLLLLTGLLSGCWDELQYKDITIVPLMGISEESNEIKTYYSFPTFETDSIVNSQSEGKGITTRDSRNDANHRTMEALDFAHLEVLLLSDTIAKKDLTPTLDMFIRTPRNRITSYVGIVEGDMEQYFKPSGELHSDVSDYYPELLRTVVLYSFASDVTLHQTTRLLFDESMDISLPYIKIVEGIPKVDGIALFSKRIYTGKNLTSKEALLSTIMKKNLGQYTRITQEWKEQKVSITFEVIKVHRDIDISEDRIDVSYELQIGVEEFTKHDLYKREARKELEKFLSEELTKEFNEVITKTQEAKSDIIGFGRYVHAFHTKLWEQGDWQETYSNLPIEAKVKVEMKRTSILD